MESEDRTLICDLIVKAYDHHKTHARFEETQRAWMVAAYFTFTGLVYAGVISRGSAQITGLPESFSSFWLVALAAHFVVGILIMISVAKVSGEFRRHFSRAEKILSDVRGLCKSDEFLRAAFRNVLLETAAIKETKEGKEKRRGIVLFSNAAVHAYMFAFLTALDVHLMVVGLWEQQMVSAYPMLAAALWFFGTSAAQHVYINLLERTGT